MADYKLQAGDIGFNYGGKLPNKSIKVETKAEEDPQTGKILSASITVTYELDPAFVFSSKRENNPTVAGGYELSLNEVGYSGKADIFKGNLANSEMTLTFSGQQAYLNARIPLKDAKKRENITLISY